MLVKLILPQGAYERRRIFPHHSCKHSQLCSLHTHSIELYAAGVDCDNSSLITFFIVYNSDLLMHIIPSSIVYPGYFSCLYVDIILLGHGQLLLSLIPFPVVAYIHR